MKTATRVEEKLRKIREHQDKNGYPVHVIPLAEALGLNVYFVDWDDSMSGKIERDGERAGPSGYAIYVNKNHHPNRRRFTIAHEIAHFVLHQEEIGDGVFDDAMYRSGLPQRAEFEANRLAADILMPWHLLNQAMATPDYTVASLADHFQVSKSAMSIRLGVPYETVG
ncbi:ImmA/IrrE family metallo-endopeptidase [Methyloceanibacter sp.]|uniref:ImmA/IrrE family metallo-endopeptidase n=1 Tax=Methyloceanibacter sp. TaxID=1965321 RepID=UPI002CD193B1|nr:ImmA/IrrE family metallo-endopeptidase [Methyloceanibacter sp.]HML91885.1 ImmA/IrrE family metallo-endopeptidase [Methyloceanibacter sp.]